MSNVDIMSSSTNPLPSHTVENCSYPKNETNTDTELNNEHPQANMAIDNGTTTSNQQVCDPINSTNGNTTLDTTTTVASPIESDLLSDTSFSSELLQILTEVSKCGTSTIVPWSNDDTHSKSNIESQNKNGMERKAIKYKSLREAIGHAILIILHQFYLKNGYKLSKAELLKTQIPQTGYEIRRNNLIGLLTGLSYKEFLKILESRCSNDDDVVENNAVVNASENSHPPFTIQRLTEVIVSSDHYYTQTHKLCNGIEKLLLVTSSTFAFGGGGTDVSSQFASNDKQQEFNSFETNEKTELVPSSFSHDHRHDRGFKRRLSPIYTLPKNDIKEAPVCTSPPPPTYDFNKGYNSPIKTTAVHQNLDENLALSSSPSMKHYSFSKTINNDTHHPLIPKVSDVDVKRRKHGDELSKMEINVETKQQPLSNLQENENEDSTFTAARVMRLNRIQARKTDPQPSTNPSTTTLSPSQVQPYKTTLDASLDSIRGCKFTIPPDSEYKSDNSIDSMRAEDSSGGSDSSSSDFAD